VAALDGSAREAPWRGCTRGLRFCLSSR